MKLKITMFILLSFCIVDFGSGLYNVVRLSKNGVDTFAYIIDKQERHIRGNMNPYRVAFIRVDSVESKPTNIEISNSNILIDSVSSPVNKDIRTNETYPLLYLSDKSFKLGPIDKRTVIHAGFSTLGGNILFLFLIGSTCWLFIKKVEANKANSADAKSRAAD